MPELYFPLFPQGSLDSSVITVTWIGVFVVVFFNLRFGWVLSGLVVPGYIVPLLIVKPLAASVTILEAVVTYLIVWLFSERMSRWGHWSALFGRDRFFALVLVSILVRVSFDGWLLPGLGAWATERWNLTLDYQSNLHSFGLIVIALMANQFWKPGLVRGAFPVAISIALTYFLVRFVLMEFTNFRISDLGYMYEDVAASIMATPKAYIILVTTALLASRMNLHYGWDYNGILIPSLIALQWFQPSKIVTSLVEAGVILVLAELLLRTPLFANRSIEGARKLLLFFNIGFFYKIAMGWTLFEFAPHLKPTDFFGFGYLLSTLIAIKIHDREILGRLTRATVQTSFSGVLLGTLVGFGLDVWGVDSGTSKAMRTQTLPERELIEIRDTPETLATILAQHTVSLYSRTQNTPASKPSLAELRRFREGMSLLLEYYEGQPNDTYLLLGSQAFQAAGFDLIRTEGRYLVLRPHTGRGHHGLYIFDLEAEGALSIQVPDPLEQRGLLSGAEVLFHQLGARILAVSGSSARFATLMGSGQTLDSESFFHTLHTASGATNVLQLRAYTRSARRQVLEYVRSDLSGEAPVLSTPMSGMIWIQSRFPQDLSIPELERLTGPLDLRWGRSPLVSFQGEASWTGFAELLLDKPQLQRLQFSGLANFSQRAGQSNVVTVEQYVRSSLLQGTGQFAAQGSDLYVEPSLEQLMYLDAAVLTPLIQWILDRVPDDQPDAAQLSDLRALNIAAGTIGLRIERHVDPVQGQEFLVLEEDPTEVRKYWGIYIFRVGVESSLALQVPRPVKELNTLEFAADLFARSEALGLFVSGAHPAANPDGSADVTRAGNHKSVFNLVNQVMFREMDGTPFMMGQVRGLDFHARAFPPEIDIALAFDSSKQEDEELSPLAGKLAASLQELGIRTAFAGSESLNFLHSSGSFLPQARYVPHTQTGKFAMLWLSPEFRARYKQQDQDSMALAPFVATGIPLQEGPLSELLLDRGQRSGFVPDPSVQIALNDFLTYRDINPLWAMRKQLQMHQVEYYFDTGTARPYLLIAEPGGPVLGIASLAAGSSRIWKVPSFGPMSAYEHVEKILREMAESGGGWVVFSDLNGTRS